MIISHDREFRLYSGGNERILRNNVAKFWNSIIFYDKIELKQKLDKENREVICSQNKNIYVKQYRLKRD